MPRNVIKSDFAYAYSYVTVSIAQPFARREVDQ